MRQPAAASSQRAGSMARIVTGEVSEQEYRGQREEFKGLLQRNLHSIEEIKDACEQLKLLDPTPGRNFIASGAPNEASEPQRDEVNPTGMLGAASLNGCTIAPLTRW